MAIERISDNLIGRTGVLLPQVPTPGGRPDSAALKKALGEPIPKLVDVRHDPFLAALFGQLGVAARIQKKLNRLSRKRGKIIPAKGTIASALNACEETDGEDLVFVGVEFLAEYHGEEETVAGVLAHEWGHLVSEFPNGVDSEKLNWNQVFELRRDEEAAADAYSGRMLYLMGHKPDGIIRFLSKDGFGKSHTHKYHGTPTRIAIIRRAFEETKRKQQQVINLRSIVSSSSSNPFTAQLIAVA